MIGVEIPGWYDGVAYYMDTQGNRYAPDVHRTPIGKDEVCKLGRVYKVDFKDERGIKYKIKSSRDLYSKDLNEKGI